MNILVYFCGNSGWFYDCDSFLGYWGITWFIFEDYSGWAYNCDSFLGYWGNNLVYFWDYSGWSMIVIVFWAIENNLVYFLAILVYDYDSHLGYWE